ncbi:hypothetical protein sos41_02560 [Alphaproteobacteria bacterium SO-S41]|nr:hypothetical protein sos41_02560 [Alphaproteobacteria bacterium SO-S41]
MASSRLAAWRQRFDDTRDDAEGLRALRTEVGSAGGSEALELEMAIAARIVALKKAGAGTAAAIPAASPAAWLRDLLARHGLTSADGRHLYRYRIADPEFEDLGNILGGLARGRRLNPGDPLTGRLFAFFVAERIRRFQPGTSREWDPMLEPLGVEIDIPTRTGLTRLGLEGMKRPVVERSGARQWLLSLALEAGFPLKALTRPERSWLTAYVRAVLGEAVATPDLQLEQAAQIAERHAWHLRDTYRDEAFIQLTAELALAVATLRATAGANRPHHLPVAAWLDIRQPGWRDTLPLVVEDEAAHALIDSLIAVDASRGAAGTIGALRLLVLREGAWLPALSIGADGEFVGDLKPLTTRDGRLRASPTGALADHVAGDFALFEPPDEGGRSWRVRPLLTLPEIVGFAFARRVLVQIRAPSGEAIDCLWPRGDGVRAPLLVFRPDELSDTPARLALIGSGSLSSREPVLYVLAPASWTADFEDRSGTPPHKAVAFQNALLFRLERAAHFKEPGEDLSYRVAPGEAAATQELLISGRRPDGIRAVQDRFEIFTGPPSIRVKDTGLPRGPKPEEIAWRREGEKAWRAIPATGLPDGLLRVRWIEPRTHIVRETARLLVLPRDATFDRPKTGSVSKAIVDLRGATGWQLLPHEPGVAATQIDRTTFALDFAMAPRDRIAAQVVSPAGDQSDILIDLPPESVVFIGADGRAIPPGSNIRLSDLRGARAVAAGRGMLVLELAGAKRLRSGHETIRFDREARLWSLTPAARRLLAATDGVDAHLRMSELSDRRPPIRLVQYDVPLIRRGGEGVAVEIPRSTNGALTLVERLVLEPWIEREVARIEARAGSIVEVELPVGSNGPRLVYLRDEGGVRSRPELFLAPPNAAPEPGSYQSAALDAIASRRRAAIAAWTKVTLERDGAELIADTAASLLGLPACTLNILSSAADEGLIGALLLAGDRLDAVFALEEELPFQWLTLPAVAWTLAITRVAGRLIRDLEAAGLGAKAAPMAIRTVQSSLDDIVQRDAGLRVPIGLALADIPSPLKVDALPPISVDNAAQGLVRRLMNMDDGRVQGAGGPTTISEASIGFPKQFQDRFDAMWMEDLLAACFAASMICGAPPPANDIRLRMRRARQIGQSAFDDLLAALVASGAYAIRTNA